jgi:porin
MAKRTIHRAGRRAAAQVLSAAIGTRLGGAPRSRRLALQLACACALGWGANAYAAAPDSPAAAAIAPAADDTGAAPEADQAIKAQPAGQWTGVWSRSTLLGDMGGLRSALANYGVTLGLQETSEFLGNVTGGINRGGTYDGLTTATLSVDTQKAFGLTGGTFNVSALQIHGRNLSQYNLNNLQTASGIEADDTTRLWELWYQQSFMDNTFDVKVGQQSIDQEFMVSQYSSTFVNTMFGWPAVPSYDMPAGGPAYPLSALGVRFRARPTHAVTVLAGVYDGNPAGTTVGDPQKANGSGTNFNLHNGALFIGEIQYAINQPSTGDLDDGTSKGLPGTYKLGIWYNNGRFADQRFDTGGLSLADPNSNGTAQMHHGEYSLYGVIDQMVWRASPDSARSLGVYTRVMGAPGDRSQIALSVNAGLVLKAPFDGRDNDTAGLSVGYVKVGNHASALDQDTANFNGGFAPVRGSETVVEATYQYQVNPWLQLQPDVQYVMNPGGGIANPNNPTQTIKNELILGVRANITF